MLVLLYGGAACGKSDMAEEICVGFGGKSLYIATMRPNGSDARRRVERHRAMRDGKGFDTLEHYGGLEELPLFLKKSYQNILLECIGNAVANALFEKYTSPAKAAGNILLGARFLCGQADNVIIVSNDVFADGSQYEAGTHTYVSCMGDVNRCLASEADVVIEMACGLPVYHKGKLLTPPDI